MSRPNGTNSITPQPARSDADKDRHWSYVMGWQFWRRDPGPAAVDETLRVLIMSRFNLTAVDIDKLLVLRRAGIFVGRPVIRLRVYDPTLLNGEVSEITKFLDLDTQAQAVCFEGHTEKGRPINLNARACQEKTAIAA